MHTEQFRDLESLRERVAAAIQGTARYPLLIVLVDSKRDWGSVMEELAAICDETVRLSDFCLGNDTLPDTGAALNDIKRHRHRKVLVAPLGELLRTEHEAPLLDAMSELEWQDDTRILVPLCQVREALQCAPLARRDRWAEGELAPVLELLPTCEPEQDTLILSSIPVPKVEGMRTFMGMRAYLRAWETGDPGHLLCLDTAWGGLFSSATGSLEICKFSSAFEWLRYILRDVAAAQQQWGDEIHWGFLLGRCASGDDLSSLCSRVVGLPSPDTTAFSRMLRDRPETVRWTAWLWLKACRQHRGEGDYLSLVLEQSENANDVTEAGQRIASERDMTPDDLRVLLELESVWPHMEASGDGLSPLRLIGSSSVTSDASRSRLVSALGRLTSSPQEVFEQALRLVEVSYPQLAVYPSPIGTSDVRLEAYFDQYHRSRLADHPTAELLEMVNEASRSQWLWEFKPRNAVIEELAGIQPLRQFWVDGFGLEWVPALISAVKSQAGPVTVNCRVHVARASLPSDTETNGEWLSQAEVDHRLDRLAHAYDYAFPGSFVKESAAIYELGSEVFHRIREQDKPVLVVGDHGLTRFAGRAECEPLDCPGGTDPRNGPRSTAAPTNQQNSGTLFYCNGMAFSSTYANFRVAGARTGEIHGGATLEEALVPVLIFSVGNNADSVDIVVEMLSSPVLLDTSGSGRLMFQCKGLQPPISVAIQGKTVIATPDQGALFATLVNMEPGTYTVTFFDGAGHGVSKSIVLVKGAERSVLDF